MIDMLVLRCDFKRIFSNSVGGLCVPRWPDFPLASLGVPLEQSIDRDGQVFNTRHPWEKIPSSYESMAFKIFDHRYDLLDSFYIEIKASPAKIMQGHNVYGSDDFYDCCFALLELLSMTYPQLVEQLDNFSWRLAQIDITYSFRARDDSEARAFINALHSVSHGQVRPRKGYDGTAYFGVKKSRLKNIKVYLKSSEVLETISHNLKRPDGELLNEVYTPELLAFSEGLIRWEVSLFHRYFERREHSMLLKDIFRHGLFSSKNQQIFWGAATQDLFTALDGQVMKHVNETDLQAALRLKFTKATKSGNSSTALADAAFRTYRCICRDGWAVTRDLMALRTFNRHVKMLTESGVSRAALQNMKGLHDGAEVIPFVRFIQVDFCAQYPDWYTPPPPKHVYQPEDKPQLRLVVNS